MILVFFKYVLRSSRGEGKLPTAAYKKENKIKL